MRNERNPVEDLVPPSSPEGTLRRSSTGPNAGWGEGVFLEKEKGFVPRRNYVSSEVGWGQGVFPVHRKKGLWHWRISVSSCQTNLVPPWGILRDAQEELSEPRPFNSSVQPVQPKAGVAGLAKQEGLAKQDA